PLINKIAAGEVVERPLSVVKELIENAIDAGASAITVEIADGGLTSIRVTDNGAGIPSDQILLAFARHATSKIASMEDLFEVGTLGFRGEALSSIAAVAQVEMVTKTAGQVMGMRVEIHGGELINQREVGAANGTTIVVNNLFYNTPARRKFLKKPGTEAGYIADCLQKLALGNPSLTIRYINNGEIAFQTNGRGDLKMAMLNIYGRETASILVNVTAELEDMKLTGLVAKPEAARGNRQRQSFFINGRLIQSKILTQAVEEATRTMLPSGKFPVYALNLMLPHETVDVNVHPTKMDVRFADEDGVYRFVCGAVREALTESNLIPEVRFSGKKGTETLPQSSNDERSHYVPNNNEPNNKLALQANKKTADISNLYHMSISDTAPIKQPILPQKYEQPLTLREETPQAPTVGFFTNYRILGLVFGTYWLITQDESLYLIDQHAAHERVLYEEIKEKTANGAINSQRLVAPIAIRLTPREVSLLKENLPLFTRFGFEIAVPSEAATHTPAEILAVPTIFKGPVNTGFFTDLLDKISDVGFSGAGVYAHKTEAMAMAACKASVKAGDGISETEAHGLIKKILSLENPFTCPHGRPTIIEITKRELTRRFKRS
ncbi:MAG: DNA mismatch repair endonuclease MutL, partial [Defluviitaleaceae bacterium]|nr:DNA mismatch repair endonuclease MutL [Defluviitaleaceae bacterium]